MVEHRKLWKKYAKVTNFFSESLCFCLYFWRVCFVGLVKIGKMLFIETKLAAIQYNKKFKFKSKCQKILINMNQLQNGEGFGIANASEVILNGGLVSGSGLGDAVEGNMNGDGFLGPMTFRNFDDVFVAKAAKELLSAVVMAFHADEFSFLALALILL